MKKYVDGVLVDLTAEEIAEFEGIECRWCKCDDDNLDSATNLLKESIDGNSDVTIHWKVTDNTRDLPNYTTTDSPALQKIYQTWVVTK